MIRVMLVEDDLLMRRGTRELLRTTPDITVVAEAGQADEALAATRETQPDVVLLDIRLDGSSGLDLARALRREAPEVKLLVLTTYPYEAYMRALFAAGVHGYLLKKSTDVELIEGIRAVCRGEEVLSPDVAARITRRRSGLVVIGELSEREREVLALVGEGYSDKHIGQALGLKVRTVEAYLASAMMKLNATGRTDAIRLAVQRGIIVIEP